MDELISVIVPFFNSEKYIWKCLDSIKNQTYTNFEVICVDDGSTDGSLSIVNTFSKVDSRFKVMKIKKSNAGVARNYGIDNASGKYVIFLDSDDFFELNLLERSYEVVVADRSDFCIFGVNAYNDNSEKNMSLYKIPISKFRTQPIDVENNINRINLLNRGVPWDRLYRMNYIKKNNLRFQSIKRCNDTSFSTCAILLSKRISVVEEILLHHRMDNSGSLQSNISETPLIYAQTAIYTFEEMVKRNIEEKRMFAAIDFVVQRIEANYQIFNSYENKRMLKSYLQGIFDSDKSFLGMLYEEIIYIINSSDYGLEEAVLLYDRIKKIRKWNLLDVFSIVFEDAVRKLKIKIMNLYREALKKIDFSEEGNVGIYGTGNHTVGLIEAYSTLIGPMPPNIIYIDSIKDGRYDNKLLIKSDDILKYQIRKVVVSSFVYRNAFVENIKKISSKIQIIDFYTDNSELDIFSNWSTLNEEG